MKHLEFGKNKVLFQRVTMINGRFFFLLTMYLGFGGRNGNNKIPRFIVNPVRKHWIMCFYE